MQTIRKSIYIGLGGTGVRAVAETKKMFEDSFGEGNIPPHVAFIALDFDRSVIDDRGLATDISPDFVQLPQTTNPFQLHRAQAQDGEFQWIPPQNVNFIPEYTDCGAGQVRSNGRLFAEMLWPCIEAAINSAMARVLSMANHPDGYIVLNDDHVNVYLAMSLVGGTGSALMLNVAQILHERYLHVRVIGYGVMHAVFNLMDPLNMVSPRVKSNVYASLLELDFVQSATLETPVRMSGRNKPYILNSPLFDEFYVVDNKSQYGGVVSSLYDLCNAVGCSMFYGSTDIGKTHSIDWKKRGIQWGSKTSWVQCFGVCQIVYKGDVMERFYRTKASIRLLDMLLADRKSLHDDTLAWLERTNLREDGDDYNKLIDSICSPESIAKLRQPVLLPDDSHEELRARVAKYFDQKSTLWESKIVSEICRHATDALKEELSKLLKTDGGITAAGMFLTEVDALFVKYKEEMETEAADARKKFRGQEQLLESEFKEYENSSRRFITKLTGSRSRLLNKISTTAVRCVREALEARRRDDALTVFVTLSNEVRNLQNMVKLLTSNAMSLKMEFEKDLRLMEKKGAAPSLFEIDLSYDDMKAMNLTDKDVSIFEFYQTLTSSILDLSSDELRSSITEYSYQLPSAQKYRDCNLMDIIDGMDDESYEHFKHTILRKAAPLLSLNDRGLVQMDGSSALTPISNMLRTFYIYGYKTHKDYKSRLESDDKLLPGGNVRVSFIPSDAASMKQRLFVHRVDSAVMPYCIESIDSSVLDAYNVSVGRGKKSLTPYNPHTDSQMLDDMRASNFTLVPKI